MTVFKKMTAGVLAAGIMVPSLAFAQTSTSSTLTALLAQIKALTAQIEALKQQQSTLQGQIKTVKEDARAAVKELRGQIRCGASGEDVALLQTILASDPSIFPEGIINGFYGKKTSEAVKRFQRMTGLTPTGCVGPQTMNALNNFLKKHPIIVQDGTVCALVLNGEKPKGWERKLDREREKMGMSSIPTCTGGIPQSILNAFGISSTTPFVPGNTGVTQDETIPGSGKITMCHKPGHNKVTIYVSSSAFGAHIAHGDRLGACDGSTATTTTDTIAPTISGVSSTNVTTTGVTVTWTTNEAATTQVEYGTTASYGSTTSLDSTKVTNHSAAISGLSNGTTYHFRVISKDAAGNTATSGDMTFTTGTVDTTAPSLSAITSTNLTMTGATITWTTNENSTSQVEYGTTASYGNTTTLDTALVTGHSVNLTGLTTGTTYHFRVISKDAANNVATSGDMTFVTTADTTAPVISGVSVSPISASSASISWTTNESATTKVYYDTVAITSGSQFAVAAGAGTSHMVGLTGLSASTTYYYVLESKDDQNNTATTTQSSFATTN